MRLTLTVLGIELDLSLGLATTEPEAEAPVDQGYTTSTPTGFTARYDQPDEIPLPMRNNGWGDEGNRA